MKNIDFKLFEKNSYIVVLFISNIIIRLLQHIFYSELTYTDTESYLELTKCILTMDFSAYQAIRTPVYPLVLFLHYINPKLVWIAQSIMGIINSYLIYKIAKDITKEKIALIIALIYSLSFNILFAEATLLSETTSILFLLLTVFTFTIFVKERGKKILILVGIFSALAILTRPIMIVSVPAILITILLIKENNTKRTRIAQVSYYLTPVVILLLGLSTFNYFQVNYFGINTNSGLGLVNISGAFIEKCEDPEFQEIKDIIIEYKIKRGTHNWVAHHALDEIMERTGLSFSELSKKLTAMSFQLFIQNPHLYLKSIIPSYVNYWRVGILWEPMNIKPKFVRNIIEMVWKPQKILLGVVNILFIISLLVIIIVKRSLIFSRNPVILLMVLLIMFSSILQALVEALENTRYKLPFQPLILIFVIKIIYETFQTKIKNNTSFINSYLRIIKEV